jgi:hypothetical protein
MAPAGPSKKLCGAKTPHGKYPTCHNVAGKGTKHKGVGRCSRHLGATANHEKAASVELARIECETLGIPIQISPAEALLAEVFEAQGNVVFYRNLIKELPTHPEPDVFVVEDGEGYWQRGKTGVYGRTYHVSGVPTGEGKPHVLVQLYNDERKRRREAAEGALKAGVEERRIRIAEADAERIMDAQMKVLMAMGLTDRLEEFRQSFATHLRGDDGDEPAHLGAAQAG